jgi:hypothetical protein
MMKTRQLKAFGNFLSVLAGGINPQLENKTHL